jgi:hypothetical protein
VGGTSQQSSNEDHVAYDPTTLCMTQLQPNVENELGVKRFVTKLPEAFEGWSLLVS